MINHPEDGRPTSVLERQSNREKFVLKLNNEYLDKVFGFFMFMYKKKVTSRGKMINIHRSNVSTRSMAMMHFLSSASATV